MEHKFLLLGKDYEWDWFVADTSFANQEEFTPYLQEGEYQIYEIQTVDFITSTTFKLVYGNVYEKVVENHPRITWEEWCSKGKNHIKEEFGSRLIYKRNKITSAYFLVFTSYEDVLDFLGRNDAIIIPTQFTTPDGEKIFGIAV